MKRSGFTRPPPLSFAKVATQWTGGPITPRAPAERIFDGKDRAVVAVPKRVYVRSKALREAYRLIPCQFDNGPGICGALPSCCAHANWAVFGKGKAIKAGDDRGAAACASCHAELDQGREWTGELRKERWWRAHVRSVRLLVEMGAWPAAVPVPDIEVCPL